MAFIMYRCCGRHLLQIDQTGAYIGAIIAGHEGESGRAFSYDFGTTYYPEDIINFKDFPELAKMPFFAVDYSAYHREFIPKLDPKKDRKIYTLLTAECKFGAGENNQVKQGEATINLLWQYTPPNLKGYWKIPIWSLTVNEDICWMGNRDGLLLGFNHEGEIINQQELGCKINCFVTNDQYFYCGCDNGKIYDLRGKKPQSLYNIRSNYYDSGLYIFNLTFADNNILIVDTYGNLKLVNDQWQTIWENKDDQLWRSWFLAYHDQKIFVGHSKGLNCYDLNKGKLIWKNEMKSSVLWGEIVNQSLMIGTSDGQIYKVNQQGDFKVKKSKMRKLFQGESALFSGVILPEQKLIITSDYQGHIYGVNFQGKLIFQSVIEKGAILNLKAWKNLIFAVTTEGTILAFDLKNII